MPVRRSQREPAGARAVVLAARAAAKASVDRTFTIADVLVEAAAW